ncbi:hypothetical protein GGR58DRAFT_231648 [Xylaria digitata]|nr:hypothetical protein GGR58DRAFT_231648 [Xylaria digitata]
MVASDSPSLLNVQNIKRFSDLTLNCEDESFKAHRATVCLHSPVMTAALTGEFIEAQTNEIKISFDLPSGKRLIDFMYTGDYHLSSYTASDILSTGHMVNQISTTEGLGKEVVLVDSGGDSAANAFDHEQPTPIYEQLISHSRMNAIADYYDIPALRTLSTEKTRSILESNWSAKDFCDFLRDSSGSTGDWQFHQTLGTIAMEHVDEILENRLLDDIHVVRELSPYMLSKCCSQLSETRSRLKTAVNDCQSACQKAVNVSTSLTECRSLLSKWSSCRNQMCEAKFNCFFDTKGPLSSPTYFLRCSHCNCRHE